MGETSDGCVAVTTSVEHSCSRSIEHVATRSEL